jgi:hypothetical protein
MFSITTTGSFNKSDSFLKRLLHIGPSIQSRLAEYAQQGVEALSAATPVRTGLTAESWGYEINHWGGTWRITWTNTHIHEGVAIAILLQYGHGTGNGGYIQGRDYINPAIRPIFDKIADDVWRVVTSEQH